MSVLARLRRAVLYVTGLPFIASLCMALYGWQRARADCGCDGARDDICAYDDLVILWLLFATWILGAFAVTVITQPDRERR